MTSESDADRQWERVAADLRAHREAQHQAWGGVEDELLARYMAGLCSPEEKAQVEQAREQFPRVRECLDVVADVFKEFAGPLSPPRPSPVPDSAGPLVGAPDAGYGGPVAGPPLAEHPTAPGLRPPQEGTPGVLRMQPGPPPGRVGKRPWLRPLAWGAAAAAVLAAVVYSQVRVATLSNEVAGLRASAAPRQYYSGWTHNWKERFYYRSYYYKPKPDDPGYQFHHVVYYQDRPKFYYWYNPQKKVFWGRSPVGAAQVPRYSLLPESARKGSLKEIGEAFPPPGPMPPVPGSADGVLMEPPPDDLPLPEPPSLQEQ
jgi:hypothetical protein